MKKIWLDNERFVACEVESSDCGRYDYYICPKNRVDEVVKAMKDNGMCVLEWFDTGVITINRRCFKFKGERYTLKQCSDIFEWFGDAQVYEFTYYYDRVVFHTPSGFFAAYIEDTSNYIGI